MVPEDLRYTEEHEWVAPTEPGTVRVGITDYAQSQLGDVVHVQLPEVGAALAPGDPVGEVESTKSVSGVYAPVAGEVVASNSDLEDRPELVNSDPYGEGWMIEIKLADQAELDTLMTAADYRSHTERE
ncbi:MAG TPA: glycine cleavage system protein GcvH [Pseudonocardiaceae bacterium]|nr:glycine cleavage system protein GcvH [Pseudonocardiaceae bacterium]